MSLDNTRRSFLRGLGIASTVGIAGCTGQSGTQGDSTTGSTTESGGSSGSSEFTMDVATAYKIGTTEHYPVMQEQFKKNVESETDGRIEVKLHPNGVLGAGSELAKKVQSGTVAAAQFSFSNFSPYASAVDLVNLPYFAGTNQQFVNLVTSDTWGSQVHDKVRQNGFEPLFYLVIDPRALALRNGIDDPIKTPSDVDGLKHRIPGSKILEQAWNLAGANPTPIAWGETPSAIQEGVADSLHVGPEALVAFGFEDLVSHVSLIDMVEDAQVYAMNKQWYDDLPSDLQTAVDKASEKTFKQNLEQVAKSRENSKSVLKEAGVEFYELTDSDLSKWKETVGYQRSKWDSYKKDLAGSMENFAKLETAMQSESEFNVN